MLERLKQNSKWILAALVACAISFGAGWATKTPKEIVKIEEKIVERIVEKITETEKKKSEQKKTTKVVTKPDGTTETTTTETNSDVSETISDKEKESDVVKEKTSTTEKTVPSDAFRPNYSLGAEATTDFSSFSHSYRATAGYRVLGNLWLTSGYHFQHNELGVGLRIDF